MKRLTHKIKNKSRIGYTFASNDYAKAADKLGKYEDTGLTPEEAGALAQGIVRCKGCKHHILHKYSPRFYKCRKIHYLRARLVSGDFGCVRGEKG